MWLLYDLLVILQARLKYIVRTRPCGQFVRAGPSGTPRRAETPGKKRRRCGCSDGRRPGSGARPGDPNTESGNRSISLCGLVQPGHLAAPAGPSAGRAGSVHRLLDSTVVRAHVSTAGAPQKKATTVFAPSWSNGTLRSSFRPGTDARAPSPTTRNDTRRARPWNGASVGSNNGDAWPPATTNTHSGSWVFCTWQWIGSG